MEKKNIYPIQYVHIEGKATNLIKTKSTDHHFSEQVARAGHPTREYNSVVFWHLTIYNEPQRNMVNRVNHNEPQGSMVNSVRHSKTLSRSIHIQKIFIIQHRQKERLEIFWFPCCLRSTLHLKPWAIHDPWSNSMMSVGQLYTIIFTFCVSSPW